MYNLAFIVINTVVGIILAIFICDVVSKKLKKLYQSAVLLPYLMSIVIISYIVFAFLSTENGMVNNSQLRFVTNTASGMGLIKCGSVVIPFDNQISKDTDLYRLYNTNIHEKIAEQKKREMQKNVE